MEEFKLKSIEEFDELFVAERKKKEAPAAPKSSLIPQIEEPAEIDIFSEPADTGAAQAPAAPSGDSIPGFAPVGSAPGAVPSPRAVAAPPAPLYDSPKMSQTDVQPFGYKPQRTEAPTIPGKEEFEEEDDELETKQSAGAYIGKAIAVIMIVLTVLVFIFGSFITVFLDTSRSLGKYKLSTQSVDITDKRVSYGKISKGDLIISEKIDIASYTKDDFVTIPSADAPGCDIAVLDSVETSEDGQKYLSLVNTANLTGRPQGYMPEAVLGRVKFYVPKLAGLLGFALSNSVLFILLFIAFVLIWSLVIVFIEMSQKMKKYDDDEDEDDDDD